MLKQLVRRINSQSKVKVIARAQDERELNSFWFTAVAAAIFATAFYFFSFFFGFTGGRAPAKS